MNLHIYPSAFRHESRILRITKSLARAGLFPEICVASVWEEGLEESEALDGTRRVWRARLWMGRVWGAAGKAIRHLEWMARVALKFLPQDVEAVNCHALTVLPLGVLFKMLKGSLLIYDPHELETETAGLSRARRWMSRLVERALIPFADATFVVNESIAAWYRDRYRISAVYVIRNFPEKTPPGREAPIAIRERLGIGKDTLLFLYLGLLDAGRGIEILLRVFSRCEDRHLLFLGYGPLADGIESMTQKYSNIHMLHAVSPDQVLDCARQADVGIALIEDLCLSYHYALPNKLFEYISAALPVLVSDLPEMAKLIDDYRCGWKIPCNEEAVSRLIRGMARDEIREKAANSVACRGHFEWAMEEKALLSHYAKLIPTSRASAPL